MPEEREDLLTHYRSSRDALLTAIAGLSEEQLSEPSLDGWSVKDHLAHLASWDELRAGEVERISAGFESAWRPKAAEGDAFGELSYTLRRDLSLPQVQWELETSRNQLLDALAAATPRGLDGSRYGETGLRSDHEAEHTEWIVRWRGERGY